MCLMILARWPTDTCWEPWPKQGAEPMSSSTQKPNTTGQRRWALHKQLLIVVIQLLARYKKIVNMVNKIQNVLCLFCLQVACQLKRVASPGCSSVSVKWQQFSPTSPPLQAPKQLHALFNDCHTLVYGFVPHCTQVSCFSPELSTALPFPSFLPFRNVQTTFCCCWKCPCNRWEHDRQCCDLLCGRQDWTQTQDSQTPGWTKRSSFIVAVKHSMK